MQWIKLVPEDAGIQNLRADSRRPVITRNVDAVPPYPSTDTRRISKDMQRDTGKHQERRAEDRRARSDRRKQQVPVLLDTRSKHDRRAIDNRRSISANDTGTEPSRHSTRLNLYA